MIKKLMTLCVAAMAATGAWAEISFGDTYNWDIAKYLDGWYESEMRKASGVSIYTGSDRDAGTETRMLVEIVGASSKKEINPIIENLGFDGKLTASVWTDKELRDKAMPSSSTSRYWERESGWIDDRTPGDISNCPGDNCEYNDVGYEYENDDFGYEWPMGLWPNGMTDDGRFWIVVDIKPKKKNCWSGLGEFKVRLSGDDSPSVILYATYSPTDTWMNIIVGFDNIFRGIKILNKKSHFLFNIDFYEPWSASYNTPIHNYWADGFVDVNHRVTLELPEAGTLYLSSHWYDLIDDDKISGADSAELVEVDELADVAGARSYFFENGTAFPFGAAYWKVKVNSKRKIYIDVGEDDDFEITRMQFFPKSGKSVAVEASWVSLAPETRYQLNENDDIGYYLQGYVTGTGVYKVGETVSLKAIPGPGEEFSHWELMYGNFPDGIETTKATLNFKVTDACAGTADERKQMVVKAVWKERMWGGASDESSLVIPDVASVYDGYLMNGDVVVGTMQAKVTKPKKGEAKVTVTVQITGEKKLSIKGQMNAAAGAFIGETKDGRVLSLMFNMDEVKGAFGNYEISGVRNLFSSKDKAEVKASDELLAPWIGAMNMIIGDGTLSVTIAKKGKVTVKGTIDGEKISAKAQALIGEDMICIPVIYSKKTVKLAFTIWLPLDGGEAEVVGLDGAIIGKAGTLKTEAKFYIDGAILSDIKGIVTYNGKPALPEGESVSQSKTKWVVANGVKAAKVAYKKGVLSITEGKKGGGIANISGLKLTYKSKDGSYKGSFTVYAIENGKLKKHKASISGVLVNGIGYGTATIKKIGTWAIEIK